MESFITAQDFYYNSMSAHNLRENKMSSQLSENQVFTFELLQFYEPSCDVTFPDPTFWKKSAKEAIKKSVEAKPIVAVAKNVILFLGDGMGIQTVTAARILAGQMKNNTGEEGMLSFDNFQHVGLSKVFFILISFPSRIFCFLFLFSPSLSLWSVISSLFLSKGQQPLQCFLLTLCPLSNFHHCQESPLLLLLKKAKQKKEDLRRRIHHC